MYMYVDACVCMYTRTCMYWTQRVDLWNPWTVLCKARIQALCTVPAQSIDYTVQKGTNSGICVNHQSTNCN